jgi:hypothetical protein
MWKYSRDGKVDKEISGQSAICLVRRNSGARGPVTGAETGE